MYIQHPSNYWEDVFLFLTFAPPKALLQMANIFEKILYGLRVVNDNILVLNEKMETLIGILSCHENVIGMEEGDEDEQH